MSKHVGVDQGLLREIDEEGVMTNPYREMSTLVEKIRCLRGYVLDAAKAGEYRTYDEVTSHCSIHPTRRGRLLGFLGLHEDRLGNPPLPALVVSAQESKNVGTGYFIMVEKARHLADDIPEDEARRREIWQRHVSTVFEEWRT